MFLTEAEKKLGDEFESKGYIIRPVADQSAFESIESTISRCISDQIKCPLGENIEWLNNTHKKIKIENLNDFRLKIIQGINSEANFRRWYFLTARPYLDVLVGNELAMQMKVNLSIQLPQDASSLLPVHADTWSGDSPFEVVVWLPLVDCYKTKTMFLLPPKKAKILSEKFADKANGNSESLFKSIENDVEWITIKRGEVMIFNQTLPHGNRINLERETRWSMNCRFKGVFTPYADKKIGEFFEPVTLRRVSETSMAYSLPNLK